MKLAILTITILALLLISCNGPKEPTSEAGPENTLIETPEYTGVIISENGASEFGYLFDQTSTGFWEPSIDDVSSAEKCIKQFLVSVPLNRKQIKISSQRLPAIFVADLCELWKPEKPKSCQSCSSRLNKIEQAISFIRPTNDFFPRVFRSPI